MVSRKEKQLEMSKGKGRDCVTIFGKHHQTINTIVCWNADNFSVFWRLTFSRLVQFHILIVVQDISGCLNQSWVFHTGSVQ